MLNLFKPKLLIDDNDAECLSQYFFQIINLFGEDILSGKKTVLPNRDFFNWKHISNEDSAQRILEKIKTIMDIDQTVIIKYFKQGNTRKEMESFGDYKENTSGNAGMFLLKDQQYIIRINRTLFDEPMMLVSTIAHELSHYKLLIERSMTENDEFLTEVLTVLYGFGIFSGNAAMIYRSWSPDVQHTAWSIQKQGYLNQFMWGYVMALNQLFKKEKVSTIYQQLNSNVYDSMNKSLRFFKFSKIDYHKMRTTTGST